MKHNDDHRDDGPTTTTRIAMAVVGVGILLVIFYLLGGNSFPTEISYDRLR